MQIVQEKVVSYHDQVYYPIAENQVVYSQLFELYSQLHDGFGVTEWRGSMANIMKELMDIREQQRN